MKTWQELKQNPQLWDRYFVREKVIRAIRDFFNKEGFHEVETPLLVPSLIPESYLEVFETTLLDRKRRKKKMYLTTSPEASLKKLLVAGIGNCFEITKSFRNEETGSLLHNPEFTILEWYRVNADYKDIMKDCERLLMHIYRKTQKVNRHSERSETQSRNLTPINIGRNEIPPRGYRLGRDDKHHTLILHYQGKTIDLTPPWERISVDEACQQYAGFSLDDISDSLSFSIEKIAGIATKKGYRVNSKNTWEEIFNQIFLNEVEPHLGTGGKPTIIYDYPRPLAALARAKPEDPRLAERFEFYIGGMEIGDCYMEFSDPEEMELRFTSERAKSRKKGKTDVLPDTEFLQAMKRGLPPCAGIAVGIDRLVMLFADTASINDVLLFPMSDMLK